MAVAHNGNLTNASELRESLEMQGASSPAPRTARSSAISSPASACARAPSRQAVSAAMDSPQGRVFAGRDVPAQAHRRPRPAGLPPAVHRRAGGRLGHRQRELRARRHRRPGSCATWSRARSSPSPATALRATAATAAGPPRSAFSSSSTSRGRTPWWTAAACTPPGSGRAPSWRSSTPCRRTWSSACPIPALTPRSDMPGRAASPTAWASSRTSTSAAPSSSRAKARRENAVRIKLNAIASTVRGKRVILVDDSIVRGTTIAHHRRAAARGRGRGGACAPLRAAVPLSLLFRHGHRLARQPHRRQPHHRGDPRHHRRGLRGLPELRQRTTSWADNSHLKFLRGLLHRRIPLRDPQARRQEPIRAEAERAQPRTRRMRK